MNAHARKVEVERIAVHQARQPDDGKIWCGPCDARVPPWFGRDCISVRCPLKGIDGKGGKHG